MAEEKELSRMEMRVLGRGEYTSYSAQVNGTAKCILLGLAYLVNQVADDMDVSSGYLLALLAQLCEGLRKDSSTVTIDLGAVERAMWQDDDG